MKHFIVIVLSVIGMKASAQVVMNIIQNNGTVLQIPVNSIDSIAYATSSVVPPVLNTLPVTSITATDAYSGGEVTNEGGASVTQRGVCWSNNPIPTTTDNLTNDGSGPGSYSSFITGLANGGTYYVRAYDVNSAGVAYVYSYRPRWRGDASGAGLQAPPGTDIQAFTRRALDLALAWPNHDERTLGDMVERLDGMPSADHRTVWDLIDAWSAEPATPDRAKAALRDRIRLFALTQRGLRRGLGQETRNRARDSYKKLESRDPVIRHAWLFANQWVQESSEEVDDDFTKREERIHALRMASLNQIWTQLGFDGVLALMTGSDAPGVVGHYVGLCLAAQKHVLISFVGVSRSGATSN